MPVKRHTKRELKDKRFRATEYKIRLAFASVRDTLNVGRLIKIAGISRSTLNRHHGTIYNIIPDYEDYILHEYKLVIRHFSNIRHTQLRNLYERTFIFLISYRRIMEFIMEYGNENFFERLLVIIEPKALSTKKVTNHEMFIFYSKEVAVVIEEWARAGFNKDDIPVTLDKIAYLTNTAHHYLSPVINK